MQDHLKLVATSALIKVVEFYLHKQIILNANIMHGLGISPGIQQEPALRKYATLKSYQ